MCSNNSLQRNVMRNTRFDQTCCLTVVCQVPGWTFSASSYLRCLPSCSSSASSLLLSWLFLSSRSSLLSWPSSHLGLLSYFLSWSSHLCCLRSHLDQRQGDLLLLGPQGAQGSEGRSREIKGGWQTMANDGRSRQHMATRRS